MGKTHNNTYVVFFLIGIYMPLCVYSHVVMYIHGENRRTKRRLFRLWEIDEFSGAPKVANIGNFALEIGTFGM